LNEIQEKRKQTCLVKYNADNPFKAQEVQEKTKKTFIAKYNTDSPLKSKEIRNKIEQTCLDRYGAKYYILSDEHHEKMIEKYDCKYPFLTEENIKKAIINSHTPEANQKRLNSIKNIKYSTEHLLTDEVRQKAQKTMIKRYGVPYALSSKDIIEKRKKSKRKNRFEQFKEQLKIYKNMELISSKEDYINCYVKIKCTSCRFYI